MYPRISMIGIGICCKEPTECTAPCFGRHMRRLITTWVNGAIGLGLISPNQYEIGFSCFSSVTHARGGCSTQRTTSTPTSAFFRDLHFVFNARHNRQPGVTRSEFRRYRWLVGVDHSPIFAATQLCRDSQAKYQAEAG